MSFRLHHFAYSLIGFLFLSSGYEAQTVMPPEICENAIDDDEDGLIDINDPDCACELIEPISRIPNPSFEEHSCCPLSITELHCADTWIQASTPTTDYLNTCGWMGWPGLPPPLPFPDGNAAVGFRDGRVIMEVSEPWWKEYVGACLTAPLLAGTAYRIEFFLGFTNYMNSPPISLSFFGTTDCANLPFGGGDETFGCPTNGPGWTRLGSVSLSGNNNWVKSSIEIVPNQDIYAMTIGPACQDRIATTSYYYFIDNLILDEQSVFDFQISTNGEHPCSNNFTLQMPDADSLAYQWYKDGIALIGETNAQLKELKRDGAYQVRVSGGSGCKITNVYHYARPVEGSSTREYLCEGRSLTFGSMELTTSGTYWDTLKTVENCDSIVQLELVDAQHQQSLVNAKIFESEKYTIENFSYDREGVYPVLLTSSAGCDSLVTLHLSFYKVFTPNAFSPNGDGINDFFTIMGEEELVEIRSMLIFDKWGNQVFEGKEMTPNLGAMGWDGSIRGKPASSGIYLYTAELLMDDGLLRRISGSLTVVR